MNAILPKYINKVCSSLGGISKIALIKANYDITLFGRMSILELNLVGKEYIVVKLERYNSKFADNQRDSAPGPYYKNSFTLNIKKGRQDIDDFLANSRKSKYHLVYQDENGLIRVVESMRLLNKYTTGQQLKDKNQYVLNLSSESKYRSRIVGSVKFDPALGTWDENIILGGVNYMEIGGNFRIS